MAKNKPPIVITMGDPCGIGGEITLKSWHYLQARPGRKTPLLVLDDPQRLQKLSSLLGFTTPFKIIHSPDEAQAEFFNILPLSRPVPLALGQPSPDNAPMIIEAIDRAVQYCLNGRARAMVTNPIAKNILMSAGFAFAGHTEYLAELTGDTQPMMLLINPKMAVLPLTIHISLNQVAGRISKELLISQISHLHGELQKKYPHLAQKPLCLLGLNPHAGESGKLGSEELQEMIPAVQHLRQMHIDISDPTPADTAFSPENLRKYGVFIGCYHDQVLTPIKMLDMHRTVNVTLGLKIIRTSPDHGTAFGIAPHFTANPSSMLAAIKMAEKSVNK